MSTSDLAMLLLTLGLTLPVAAMLTVAVLVLMGDDR